MNASRDEPAPEVQGPLFYTVAEAAKLLRVDKATIYRSIRENAFPAVPPPASRRSDTVTMPAPEAWTAACITAGEG